MFDESVKTLLDWIRAHADWAVPFAFVVAFCESLAFVSFLVPASIILIGLGALAVQGVVDPWAVGLGAVGGAVVGDAVSFWIGRAFKDRIAGVWPFSRQPELLVKGRAFFARYGGASVFIGRFFGPLRAVVPIVAGVMNMREVPFQIANVTSAFLWAPAWMMGGVVLTKFLKEIGLAENMGTALFIVFIVTLPLGYLGYRYFKKRHDERERRERAAVGAPPARPPAPPREM
jgi:membrane protein DedA with SNARE-associated domain